MATIGRAKIEHKKQIELENIQTQKLTRLKQLDIKYETADKAKTSFGYIGITFLTVLFGTIFLNDFLKVCIYYFNHLREWWRRNNDREHKKMMVIRIKNKDKEMKNKFKLRLNIIMAKN